MPQKREGQTTRLNAQLGINVLAILITGSVLGYLIWRFLWVYINDLDNEAEEINALIRYFSGILLELLMVWGIAYLNFRLIFLRFFAQNNSKTSNLYWAWIAILAFLGFALLEYRTYYEPNYADENVLLTLLLTAFVIGYAYSADYFRTRRLQLTLIKDKREAELNVLKAQVKPHFLFNTLNIIYNSAQKHQDEETAQLVLELSNLLRFSIQEANQEYTSLHNEVAFLERYIRFQSLRLPPKGKIDLQVKLPPDIVSGKIAPLLLIPFIENAFQYGISMNENCFIHIELALTETQLKLDVQNSIAPNAKSKQGLGTGIANTRERLLLLYPGRHTLHIQSGEKVFQVALSLDLKTENPKS